jgi:uncharacterized membrane protein
MKIRLQRWTLAAALAATLGFGAARALAAPADPSTERACIPEKCRSWCRSQGQTGGACFEGSCFCYIT